MIQFTILQDFILCFTVTFVQNQDILSGYDAHVLLFNTRSSISISPAAVSSSAILPAWAADMRKVMTDSFIAMVVVTEGRVGKHTLYRQAGWPGVPCYNWA